MDSETEIMVKRMCDIILNEEYGECFNRELYSLALYVGHDPDILNASTQPADNTGSPKLPCSTCDIESIATALVISGHNFCHECGRQLRASA